MLYPTLNQPVVLIASFASGILGGMIFDIFRFLTALSGKDKFSKHFFDFLATIFSCLLLFFVNLWINYGQFRIYVLLSYLLSFTLQRIIAKFLWTKLLSKWYSNITRREKKSAREKEKPS